MADYIVNSPFIRGDRESRSKTTGLEKLFLAMNRQRLVPGRRDIAGVFDIDLLAAIWTGWSAIVHMLATIQAWRLVKRSVVFDFVFHLGFPFQTVKL